CARYLDYW
nr:immunoglobulin heavy chain junction region [Mus musculus]